MIFNIYYINFPKVYEIKMMLSNIIALNKEKHTDNLKEKEIALRGKLGINFLNIFNTGLGIEGEASRNTMKSDSQKVLETFEIKTTKSVILNEIIEKSITLSQFNNTNEGKLVKIDNVMLSLVNETELRTVKLVMSGSLKGMNIPEMKGIDTNNLFNSMFKDYSYKLKGKLLNNSDEFLIKIPLRFETEFESSYSVDDLFIGKVSLVGLYKGKVKIDSLKNSFEFFQELGNKKKSNKNNSSLGIQDSQYEANDTDIPTDTEYENKEFHYLDLLAIVQNVEIPK